MSQQEYSQAAGAQMEELLRRRSLRSPMHTSDHASATRIPSSIPFTGLLSNEILTRLPGPDLTSLLPHLEPVSLSAGHGLNEFGRLSEFVYFPESAVISHVHILEDGGTTSAAIIGPEGLIGVSALLGTGPSYWAQVTIAGTALRVRTEVIRDDFRNGRAIQSLILKHLGARLAQLSQRAVCNSRHLLEERFCTWLLMIMDRTRHEQLALTHELIAQHMGARRAGITGACNALREAGIIKYRRRMMTIADRTKLESVACECYGSLKDLSTNHALTAVSAEAR
jgi:CRP-like cAMP-binding protein